MIIATKNLNFREIRNYLDDLNSLVAYVENLVPRWIAHNSYIVANQRFYTAVKLRDALTITFQQRNAATEALLKDTHIFGNPATITTIDDILEYCDKKALIEMVKHARNCA